jgi:hypothetical protein
MVTGDNEGDKRGKERRISSLDEKEAREYRRIKEKSKAVLDKCPAIPVRDVTATSDTGDGEMEEGGDNGDGDVSLVLMPSSLTLEELFGECFISLTASHTTCNWLRDEMRLLGIIDHMINMTVTRMSVCIDDLKHKRNNKEVEENHMKLLRQFKLLENVAFMNKANQGYLTIYDCSTLITELAKFMMTLGAVVLEQDGETQLNKMVLVECLLGELKLLLNITHGHELGAYRLGEHDGIISTIVRFIFELPSRVPKHNHFDLLVLSLSLLINMIEDSTTNQQMINTSHVTADIDGDDTYQDLTGDKACIKLFLKHYKRVEFADVEVPTPQKLSQQLSQQSNSPKKPPPTVKRDLLTNFSSRLQNSSVFDRSILYTCVYHVDVRCIVILDYLIRLQPMKLPMMIIQS